MLSVAISDRLTQVAKMLGLSVFKILRLLIQSRVAERNAKKKASNFLSSETS